MGEFNICLCGSQAGYPHADYCPRPYFGNDEKEIIKWREEYYLAKIKSLQSELSAMTAYANKLAKGFPEGMLPKDIEVLKQANAELASELDALKQGVLNVKEDLDIRIEEMRNLQHPELMHMARLSVLETCVDLMRKHGLIKE